MSAPLLHRLPSALWRKLRELHDNHRGTFAVELAMALPIILTLLLSGVELTRYVILTQKLERASATVADLISQARTLAETDITTLVRATTFVMMPHDLMLDGRLILSSVSLDDGGTARVNWQRIFGAGSGASGFGVEGAVATLPEGFLIRADESIIVAEVFFDFQPTVLQGLLEPTTLRTRAVFRPRFAPLTAVTP